MGLDMFLEGHRHTGKYKIGQVKKEVYELGYWRKRWGLHNYIVQHCAAGVDKCQPIYMTKGQVAKTIADINRGAIEDVVAKDDAVVFEKAIKWLQKKDNQYAYRFIIYQASW